MDRAASDTLNLEFIGRGLVPGLVFDVELVCVKLAKQCIESSTSQNGGGPPNGNSELASDFPLSEARHHTITPLGFCIA